MPRIYQIGYATVQVVGLFGARDEPFREALAASWDAGTSTTRYGRRWFLSRRYGRGHVWWGRIGYVQKDELTTVIWDPATKDFVHGEASSGVVVPFAIDLTTSTVAYQLRPGQVRPGTFTGAIQSLLNTQDTYSWLVSPLATKMAFKEWEKKTQRVTEFSFRVVPPNPKYVDAEQVEAIIEDLHLGVARISGKARDGETVNTSDDLFKQLMLHVRRKYGRASVGGVDAWNVPSEWKSDEGGVVPARRTVKSDSDEEEIPEEELIENLGNVADVEYVQMEPDEEEEPSA